MQCQDQPRDRSSDYQNVALPRQVRSSDRRNTIQARRDGSSDLQSSLPHLSLRKLGPFSEPAASQMALQEGDASSADFKS